LEISFLSGVVLPRTRKMVICHLNHNIFRSIEEEGADFEKSAHEPVT
jgi:hypothetical protein